MAAQGVVRRAAPWGQSEIQLMIFVMDKRDYWLHSHHHHPMEHKRAVLRKVQRLLRIRLGVERSVEQIRHKIADLRYKSPDRIEVIRRQIRNQRDAARRVPPPSPPPEASPSASRSPSPQQAPEDPPTAYSPPAVAPPELLGGQDLDQELSSPPHTPTPAATPEPCFRPEDIMPDVQLSPQAVLRRHVPSMSQESCGPPSRTSADLFNLLFRQQQRLVREVRLHGQLLDILQDQLQRERANPDA